MIDITKKTLGILGLILSLVYTIDLIFYWPDSGYDTFYLIKLIAYIVACSSTSWFLFFKERIQKV
jgi:hypothetical protein